jgi:hypothetical protein
MPNASEISNAWLRMSGAVERYGIAVQSHYHPGVNELATEVKEAFAELSSLMRPVPQPSAAKESP